MIKIGFKLRAAHIENALKFGRCEHCHKVMTSEGARWQGALLHPKCISAYQMAQMGSVFGKLGQSAAQAMSALGDAFKSSFYSMVETEDQFAKLKGLWSKPLPPEDEP